MSLFSLYGKYREVWYSDRCTGPQMLEKEVGSLADAKVKRGMKQELIILGDSLTSYRFTTRIE